MANNAKKTLLSGIQPTGRPHIGNYFGAMKQFVEMEKEYSCYFMIVDYHALNFIQDAKVMRENILNLALDYLAIGLDPKTSVIFKQSDVSVHTELAWIFDTITTVPFLERAHAYKDAEAKGKEVSVGTFNYPMLMAADILLYDTDVVPVGADQKQHVEITRDTAEKFNRIYGDTFKLPEAHILANVAVVPGIDGRKMSKSYGNTIPLFATDDEIEKAVMGIVTDSSGGVPKNVYEIHKLFRSESDLTKLYEEKAGKYKDLKEALIHDIKKFITPLRDRRDKLANDSDAVLKILKDGGDRARKVADKKMDEVREKVGVKLY
ncbi:MAG: tryptophan--tRNA ligase [Candidatus Taylorbacteria bacterium]|nr:tryptophan--tRNA ligase [Candidatus Taylorbacteria bacterium]